MWYSLPLSQTVSECRRSIKLTWRKQLASIQGSGGRIYDVHWGMLWASVSYPAAGKWREVLESAPQLCEIIVVENEPSAEHTLSGDVNYMALVQHLLRWVTTRRLTACLLLVVSVWMLFPLSYQSGNSPQKKDQSAPFPCQNRPCGCKTAEQCWKKCCCFTNAQKVAWAKSRGVKVPQYVVVAARSESCGKVAAKCCCKSKVAAGKSDQTTAKPDNRGLMLSLDTLRCSGIDTTVSGVPICVVPELAVSPLVESPASLTAIAPEVSPLVPIERQPPTPPPKIFLS